MSMKTLSSFAVVAGFVGTGLLFLDKSEKDVAVMELLHQQIGLDTQCQHTDKTTMTCTLGGEISVWTKTGEGWQALNGAAVGIAKNIRNLSKEELASLPELAQNQ